MQADVYFTDANPQSVSLSPNSVTVSAGSPAPYTATVVQSGNTTACTITMSLAWDGTAPVGTTESFSPNPLTMTGSNVSSTLTITTTNSGNPANRTQPGSCNFTVTAARGGNCQGNGKSDNDRYASIVAGPTCTPPSVTTNPSPLTVTYGAASATFTAAASGSPAPTVQ